MNLKRGSLIFASALIVLGIILTINALIPGTKHAQTEVLVTINNQYTMSLQQAINSGYLNENGPSANSNGNTSLSSGHNANQINIYFDGTTMTLQQAINTGDLCSSSASGSASTPNPGHSATEIEVTTLISGTTNLQTAVNNRSFCYIPQSCTAPATFGSGSTLFTVQPVGAHGSTKTGTCASGYCDGLPTANCNDGAWSLNSNTCRAAELIWKEFIYPGECEGIYPDCYGNETPGTSCASGGACIISCIPHVGGVVRACVDKNCYWDTYLVTMVCPTCQGDGTTCPAQSNYVTGGSCGTVNIPAQSAGTLNMGCPGGCVGAISGTCDAGGTWTGITNNCRQPNNCPAGTYGSGDRICTYPATTHGTTASGECNNYGSCSVTCFDGTVNVINQCTADPCAAAYTTCTTQCQPICATYPPIVCDSCIDNCMAGYGC